MRKFDLFQVLIWSNLYIAKVNWSIVDLIKKILNSSSLTYKHEFYNANELKTKKTNRK